jgi:hypothetical protein
MHDERKPGCPRTSESLRPRQGVVDRRGDPRRSQQPQQRPRARGRRRRRRLSPDRPGSRHASCLHPRATCRRRWEGHVRVGEAAGAAEAVAPTSEARELTRRVGSAGRRPSRPAPLSTSPGRPSVFDPRTRLSTPATGGGARPAGASARASPSRSPAGGAGAVLEGTRTWARARPGASWRIDPRVRSTRTTAAVWARISRRPGNSSETPALSLHVNGHRLADPDDPRGDPVEGGQVGRRPQRHLQGTTVSTVAERTRRSPPPG